MQTYTDIMVTSETSLMVHLWRLNSKGSLKHQSCSVLPLFHWGHAFLSFLKVLLFCLYLFFVYIFYINTSLIIINYSFVWHVGMSGGRTCFWFTLMGNQSSRSGTSKVDYAAQESCRGWSSPLISPLSAGLWDPNISVCVCPATPDLWTLLAPLWSSHRFIHSRQLRSEARVPPCLIFDLIGWAIHLTPASHSVPLLLSTI